MMVRGRELHCRQAWGADRWDMAADDVVLDVRVRQPDGGGGFRRATMTDRVEQRSSTQSAESIISGWSGETTAESGAEH